MASISEILLSKGQQEAESRRRRAGTWTPLVQHLASLPGQIMQDRRAEQDRSTALADAEQVRTARGLQIKSGEREASAAEATAADEAVLTEIFSTPGMIDETGTLDIKKATEFAQQKAPRLVPRLVKAAQEHDDVVAKAALTAAQTASANRANQPAPFTLTPGQQRFDADGAPLASVPAEAKPFTYGQLQNLMVNGKRTPVRTRSDGEVVDLRGNIIKDAQSDVGVARDGAGDVPAGADGVTPPLDPSSQDLMSQAGLTYNGFLALTGRMSQLPRDKETRNRASAEVQAWARARGMDVATLGSQYKAYNETLENNIARYNRTQLAEGEIAADVENLIGSVKTSGLGDVRAINAAKQWLKGELNDPSAAEYAFFLNQLVNDIALYNSASQGRATLQSDVEDAKSVVQRGISAGSLTGMQKAITASVQKMGTVLEGAVNRSRKNVWDLFGVGDKYKPTTSGPAGGTAPKLGDTKTFPNGRKGRWDGQGWEPVE